MQAEPYQPPGDDPQRVKSHLALALASLSLALVSVVVVGLGLRVLVCVPGLVFGLFATWFALRVVVARSRRPHDELEELAEAALNWSVLGSSVSAIVSIAFLTSIALLSRDRF
jgi:hypothetical protein